MGQSSMQNSHVVFKQKQVCIWGRKGVWIFFPCMQSDLFSNFQKQKIYEHKKNWENK